MLKKDIEDLQYRLNKLIESYYETNNLDEVYKSSEELDKLIVDYYEKQKKLSS